MLFNWFHNKDIISKITLFLDELKKDNNQLEGLSRAIDLNIELHKINDLLKSSKILSTKLSKDLISLEDAQEDMNSYSRNYDPKLISKLNTQISEILKLYDQIKEDLNSILTNKNNEQNEIRLFKKIKLDAERIDSLIRNILASNDLVKLRQSYHILEAEDFMLKINPDNEKYGEYYKAKKLYNEKKEHLIKLNNTKKLKELNNIFSKIELLKNAMIHASQIPDYKIKTKSQDKIYRKFLDYYIELQNFKIEEWNLTKQFFGEEDYKKFIKGDTIILIKKYPQLCEINSRFTRLNNNLDIHLELINQHGFSTGENSGIGAIYWTKWIKEISAFAKEINISKIIITGTYVNKQFAKFCYEQGYEIQKVYNKTQIVMKGIFTPEDFRKMSRIRKISSEDFEKLVIQKY